MKGVVNLENSKIYIYNFKQAEFYIKEGIKPLEININPKTRKIYFIFNREETNNAYMKWVNN
jgi:hypothetical protein